MLAGKYCDHAIHRFQIVDKAPSIKFYQSLYEWCLLKKWYLMHKTKRWRFLCWNSVMLLKSSLNHYWHSSEMKVVSHRYLGCGIKSAKREAPTDKYLLFSHVMGTGMFTSLQVRLLITAVRWKQDKLYMWSCWTWSTSSNYWKIIIQTYRWLFRNQVNQWLIQLHLDWLCT